VQAANGSSQPRRHRCSRLGKSKTTHQPRAQITPDIWLPYYIAQSWFGTHPIHDFPHTSRLQGNKRPVARRFSALDLPCFSHHLLTNYSRYCISCESFTHGSITLVTFLRSCRSTRLHHIGGYPNWASTCGFIQHLFINLPQYKRCRTRLPASPSQIRDKALLPQSISSTTSPQRIASVTTACRYARHKASSPNPPTLGACLTDTTIACHIEACRPSHSLSSASLAVLHPLLLDHDVRIPASGEYPLALVPSAVIPSPRRLSFSRRLPTEDPVVPADACEHRRLHGR
jgi:hypothetical protein